MNWMVLPNQLCLFVKLYNYRPELLPDSNEAKYKNHNKYLNSNPYSYMKLGFPILPINPFK